MLRKGIRAKFVLKNVGSVDVKNVEITTTIPTTDTFSKFKSTAMTYCAINERVITCKIPDLTTDTAVVLIWRMDGTLEKASDYVATLKGNDIAPQKLDAIIA